MIAHVLKNALSRAFSDSLNQSVEEFSTNGVELLASLHRISDVHERIQESGSSSVEISSLKGRVQGNILDGVEEIKGALSSGVNLSQISDANFSEESLEEFRKEFCFIHGNKLAGIKVKNFGELRIHKTNGSADQSGKILSSSIGLLVQDINNSFADELFHSGVKKGIMVPVTIDRRHVSVSVVLEVGSEFNVGFNTLGSDLIFKDLNRGDSMSKSADKILALDIVLDVLDRGRESVDGLVEAVKTIVHDSVLGLDIHRDGVDEGTIEFSDFGHVDLSGQSQNS